MAHVTDAEGAQAIERQIKDERQRVLQRGVMDYLKPLGDGGRKDVNKQFLTSTIRSVDLHNRRHEEDKCWKIRELERKLDDRRGSRRSRSRSRSRSRERSSRHRQRGRSRSRSPHHKPRSRRNRSRSRSRNSSPRSRSPRREETTNKSDKSTQEVDERELWAAKKAEKTKQMWEKMYSTTGTVMVQNAPDFNSSSESDDEDERVEKKKSKSSKKKKKKKKSSHDKKARKKDKKARE